MALALEVYASVNLDLVDSVGKHTSRTVEMDIGATDTVTIDDILAAALVLWTELDPLTNSALANMSITLNYREGDLNIPGAGLNADVAEVGLPLVGRPNEYGTFAIPSPASAIFVAASGVNANIVNPSGADIDDFMNLFSASGDFYLSDREHTIAYDADLFRGKRVQRRSR